MHANPLFEIRLLGNIRGISISMLVDTGSMVSLINPKLTTAWLDWGVMSSARIKMADGTSAPVGRERDLQIKLEGNVLNQKFIETGIEEDIILGMDFLVANSTTIDVVKREVYLFTSTQVEKSEEVSNVCDVIATTSEGAPPRDFSPTIFPSVQKYGLEQIKSEFPGIFGTVTGDCGRTRMVRHKINTGDSLALRQRVRRLPAHKWHIAHEELQKMIAAGVVERSESPWCSPVVLVPKKGGETRFCIDYRGLNEYTKKDSYPLPNLNEMLGHLGNSTWFSTLDLKSGYWQIEMDPEDKEKTAFSIGTGLFQFTVMPFGLCNAVATFQRLMEKVLGDLVPSVCMVYVDDIIVYGNTEAISRDNLKEVLRRLRVAGLTLSEKKCKILEREVKFLGHVINAQGTAMDPEKVAAVRDWPNLESVRDVRGFLGLATYYRKFIKGFAEIAAPLNELLRKEQVFIMGKEQHLAKTHLINALTNGPVLAQPDITLPFVLDTDASDLGLGVVLSQNIEGNERVIAYYSKGLSRAEKNYCTTRKEMLALVCGVKHFRHYLLGKPFIVRTDHSALQWLRSFKEPEGQVARWLEVLQAYEFSVVHRKGILHSNADALSRRPCFGEDCQSCLRKEERWGVRQITVVERWIRDQEDDVDLSLFKSRMEVFTEKPSKEEMGVMSGNNLLLWKQWEVMRLREGILYRIREKGPRTVWQIVVPRKERLGILEKLHAGRSSGHFGVERTFRCLQERFYWPGYRRSVEIFCAGCIACLKRNHPGKTSLPPLGLRVVGYPFERVAIDVMGPLRRTERGNRYILVVGDYFTKWVESYAIPDQEAATVASVLCSEFLCRFGVPTEIHSDQGRNFESTLFREICELMGIRKTRTTPFRPQSDGMIERFNRTLAQMLSKVVDLRQGDWDQKLPYAMLAYRSRVHQSTGFPPAEVLLGLKLRLPIDLLVPQEEDRLVTYGEFVRRHQEYLEEIREGVGLTLTEVGRKMKTRHDLMARPVVIVAGNRVWVRVLSRTKGLSPKLQARWDGPFEVLQVINDQLIRISRRGKQIIVHRSKVKVQLDLGNRMIVN